MDAIDSIGPMPTSEEKPVMPVPEAGAYFGLGRAASYDAVKRGLIPTIRCGRRLFVPTAELRRMLGLPVV